MGVGGRREADWRRLPGTVGDFDAVGKYDNWRILILRADVNPKRKYELAVADKDENRKLNMCGDPPGGGPGALCSAGSSRGGRGGGGERKWEGELGESESNKK